ncbi:hypothetical protein Cmtc_28610 [Cupriavidus sp. TKC]|uniref:hypothetical protein n=1 Tax=unclassified Cupriavidus TaxID=2640874 RepID=UPI000E951860|nr:MULTISPECIES: hypothetical protein [unclassified Cupriavidus]GMG91641.1 hypothetical protein Cmtc_28610 [Cupriavidus sp. TKC]HBD32937.1 hypothetical protein [Cupriavidus sp.]HBO82448.1 hypothetical protein [Cupriavidus sp.]
MMRKYIFTVVIALAGSSALAAHTCDTGPKRQQNDCWSKVIGNEQQAADDYAAAVQASKKVPASVKRKVDAKRKAISAEADRQCQKDKLGYPENACYVGVIQQFKDFTYEETAKYGVADMRLD